MIPASIPSPPAEFASFSVGPLTIHMYALCILAGIVVALLLTAARFKRFGGNPDVVWDVAIWAVPFGLIGGRLYHVFSSPDAYFGPDGDLSRIPRIWEGGLGIWGAVALGAVGAWIGCRRAGVRLSAFADAAAPGVLLAQAIGRWGNWFNQELFGGPTDLPWGLEIDADNPNFPLDADPGTLFHPTFLYESLWNLVGVALLLLLDRRFNLRGGRMFWLYAAYYTAGRVWIEALRIDDAEMITLLGVTQRLNVWTSVLVLVVALAILIYLSVKQRKLAAPSVYLPGKGPEDRTEDRIEGGTTDDTTAATTDDTTDGGEETVPVEPAGNERPAGNGSATEVQSADTSAAAGPDRGNLPEINDASGASASAEPATEESRESDSRK